MSCASCHRQEHAFSDTAQFSIGVDGFPGRVPCIRGLECLIGDEGEAKTLRRYDAYGVVMYEQHSQRNDGVFYDDEAMSIYVLMLFSYSSLCRVHLQEELAWRTEKVRREGANRVVCTSAAARTSSAEPSEVGLAL